MAFEAKNYDRLLGGKAKGLSDTQLQAHFGLYKGYVAKLNEIRGKLATADRSAPNYSHSDYSELRRREPVAFNGTVLHEHYFENLGDGSTQPSDVAKRALEAAFGSFDAWATDTRACLMSGHGWTLLVHDPFENKLANVLVHSEHHAGFFANSRIIAAFDAWEHAYFFDYQTAKAKYADAIISGLDWNVVGARLSAAGY